LRYTPPRARANSIISGVKSTPSITATPRFRSHAPIRPVPQARSIARFV
jgi:hypothetical protein